MKIEISIDGDSRGSELKCASDFLYALANEHNAAEGIPAFDRPVPGTGLKYHDLETGRVVNIGKPVVVEPVVTEKVSQFADAMAKAEFEKPQEEKADEPTVEDVLKMTEEGMKDVPTPVLVEALNSFGIDPATRPGKNTNAKLRGLLISAITEADNEPAAEETNNAEEIKPQEDPEVPTVEAQDESTVAEEAPEEVTIDMLRGIARSLIAANKRKVIAAAFEACGCSNFSTLKNKDYVKFYDLCKKG